MRLLLLCLYLMKRLDEWFWHGGRRGHERQQAQIREDHQPSNRLATRNEQESQVQQQSEAAHAARAHTCRDLTQLVAVETQRPSQSRHPGDDQTTGKEDARRLCRDQSRKQIVQRHGLRCRDEQQDAQPNVEDACSEQHGPIHRKPLLVRQRQRTSYGC